MALDHGSGQRYLRQLGSGTIYHWTETLAKRADMVPFDTEQAKVRIEAARRNLEELKKLRSPEARAIHEEEMGEAREVSSTLTALEKAIDEESEAIAEEGNSAIKSDEITPDKSKLPSDEDLELERKDKVIANDPQVNEIMGMRSKKEVRAYLLREFGEDPGDDVKFDLLKNLAINKRTERLFEFDG